MRKKLTITRDEETAPVLDVINRASARVSAWPDWKRISSGLGEECYDGNPTAVRDLKWTVVGVLLGHPKGPHIAVGSEYWLTKDRARALRDALTEALEAIETP